MNKKDEAILQLWSKDGGRMKTEVDIEKVVEKLKQGKKLSKTESKIVDKIIERQLRQLSGGR